MKAAVTRGLKTGSTGIHQWWFRYGSPACEPLGSRRAAWPWEALKIWLCLAVLGCRQCCPSPRFCRVTAATATTEHFILLAGR